MEKIETAITFLIWLFFIFSGILTGLDIPFDEMGDSTSSVSNTLPKLNFFIPFFFFSLSIVIFSFINTKTKQKNASFLAKFIDHVLSEGSYERIYQKLIFELLVSIFFCTAGIIGIIKSLMINVPENSLHISFVSLSAGLGIGCGFLISKFVFKIKG